jgi:Domain of unknown function (DUF4115)
VSGSPDEAYHLQLRYAAFLGLTMEGLTRATGEEAPSVAALPSRLRPTRPLWLPMLAALAPAAVIGIVYVLGRAGEGESGSEGDRQPRASAIVSNSDPGVSVSPGTAPPPAPGERTVDLVVTADRGGSWVEAHSDSESGRLLYQGTLENGRELHLAARKIWLRLGAASNVSLAVNGRSTPRELFGTVDVVVTPQGIEPAG